MICVEGFASLVAMESMGERLRAARVRAGYTSATKAAEALGVPASTYRAHENGQNEFSPDEAERYGRKFGVKPSALLTGEGTEELSGLTEVPDRPPMPPSNASFPPRYQQHSPGRVPLLGQTVGGPNGRFILNGQKVTDLFCPPMLAGVEGAYAVLVYGHSMEPKFEPGETVWLNPNAPVRSGDYVVVQMIGERNEVHSYIKRFVSRSSKVLRLKQLNPDEGESEDLEFDGEKVFSIHKIVFQALV